MSALSVAAFEAERLRQYAEAANLYEKASAEFPLAYEALSDEQRTEKFNLDALALLCRRQALVQGDTLRDCEHIAAKYDRDNDEMPQAYVRGWKEAASGIRSEIRQLRRLP